jgi:palmitoyltransferase ZDHHC9/14/18
MPIASTTSLDTSKMADSSRQSTADNSTFPQPLNPLIEKDYPASIVSSRMTDIGSEDGEDQRPTERPTTAGRPLSSRKYFGPSSDVPADNSRPSTAMSSQKTSQPPPSRRGYAGMGGKPTQGLGSTTGSAGGVSARPSSSTSRTHVPSLTSHAFFRPMSSQRLQAQRNARAAVEPQAPMEEEYTEGNPNRYSFGSNPTTQYGAAPVHEPDPMPPSRGTNATSREAQSRGEAKQSLERHTASQSLSDSLRPLQQRPQYPGQTSEGPKSERNASNSPPKPKSARSFRDSFRLSGKNGPNIGDHGREKLSSGASSPSHGISKSHPALQSSNYNFEYFTGNTAFCWGGRLQNTRDRPINILTGILVSLPAGLFLGFS